jgi:amino acid adenylation domain-containing protein
MQMEMFRTIAVRAEGTRPYQWQWAATVDRQLDLAALQSAWNLFWTRHHTNLSISFGDEVAVPQHVDAVAVPVAIPVAIPMAMDVAMDVREGVPIESTLDEAWNRGAGFEYGRLPIELMVLRAPEGDTVSFTAHHAYADGGGTSVLLAEVIAPALGLRSVEEIAATQAPDFREFVQWFARESASSSVCDYWERRFAGADVGVGLDWLRREGGFLQQNSVGSRRATRRLAPEISAQLKSALVAAGVRPSSASHLAVGLLMASAAGSQSANFGTIRALRDIELPGVRAMLGNLVNLVGVRVDVDGTATVREMLQRVRAHDRDARANSAIALHDLQRIARQSTGRPIELIVVHSDSTRVEEACQTLGTKCVHSVRVRQESTNPIAVIIGFGESVEIEVLWDPSQIYAQRAERFADRLAHMLTQFSNGLDRPIGELEVTTPAERAESIRCGDGGAALVTIERLDDAISAVARRTPAAIAVDDTTRAITYAELEQSARILAGVIGNTGTSRDAPIGICMGRDLELPACHLACWFAGRFFIPLDPELPAERLRMLAEEAGITLVIGRSVDCTAFDGLSVRVIDPTDVARSQQHAVCADDGALPRSPDDLAYAFFTSGSTGKPKVTLVAHRGVAHFLAGVRHAYGLPDRVSVVNLTPVGFDPSIIELHLPLTTGGTVGVVPPGLHVDFGRVAQTAAAIHADHLTLVPAVLARMAETAGAWDVGGFRSVSVITSGGDAMPTALSAAFHANFGQLGIRLFNAYGPTETSIAVTVMELRRDFVAPFPIGRAIPGVRLRVVDPTLRALPIGAHGELLISGTQVGGGYLADPTLTNAKFVRLSDEHGRSYRTGDRVAMDEDGVVWFHGRLDFQFKVRGMRVEAGEIEQVMCDVDGVESAVAWYVGDGADRRVVGYFKMLGGVAARVGQGVGAASDCVARLRAELKARLPSQVVPAALVQVSEWPLSASGKIDRRRLPIPESVLEVGPVARIPPAATIAEQLLRVRVAEIFAQLLRAKDAQVDSSFFDLGGDSLGAVLLIDRLMREFGTAPSIADMLADPTPIAIARRLARGGAVTRIEPVVAILPSQAAEVLHCFPGIGGLAAFTYIPLAEALRDDFRCFGYQLPGAGDGEKLSYHLRDSARLLAQRVRERSGDRPAHLVGFSFGGILAVEVAAALEAQRVSVGSVTVLDASPIRNRDRLGRLGRTALRFAGLSKASKQLRKLDELAGIRTVNGANLGDVERRLRQVMDAAGISMVAHRMSRIRCGLEVVLSNGKHTHVEADGAPPNGEKPDGSIVTRWSRYTAGGVRLTRTDASHNGLVRREGVPRVAEAIRRALADSRARR